MMYPARRELVETRPIYHLKVLVYKKGNESWKEDGENVDIRLDKEDFVLNKNSVTYEGASGTVIGNAISRVFTLVLHNSPRYSAQDFVGARVNISAIAPAEAAGNTYSVVQGGNFIITNVEQVDGAIKLTAQDFMANAEKEYKMTLVGTSWTLLEIFQDVVNQAFPHPGSSIGFEFLNDSFRVFAKPIGYSCRQMLGFIAQIACGNVYVTDSYNGVLFWNNGIPVIRTLSTNAPYNQLNQWIEMEDGAETVSISGLKALQTKNINGKDVEPPLEIKSTPYSDAYPLTINNPLITGVEAIAFSRMMPILSALSFRNFRGKHIGYPLAEYGDYAVITHRDGAFNTFLTNITWNIDGATEFECDIASSADNAADYDDSNGTIEKTESGIQRADLAEDVQASLDKADTALQSVPNTYRTANAQDAIDNTKVDKVTGKGLSTNDYTAAAKAKVDAIPSSPKYTDTVYDDTAVKNRLSAAEKTESITLSVVSSRLTGFSYAAKYYALLGAVFVRVYGTVNADLNTGYDYDVLNIGSRLPEATAALAVKCGKSAMAFAKSNGVISVRPLETGIKGYDIYITGFWFV